MKCNWKIIVEQEDIPVRGNAIYSDDTEYNKRVEDEILERLDVGEVWAWAAVTMECWIEVDGQKFVGHDHLGNCSYKDEEDFKIGGYYEQMKDAAKADMFDDICHAIKRGNIAQKTLDGERNV